MELDVVAVEVVEESGLLGEAPLFEYKQKSARLRTYQSSIQFISSRRSRREFPYEVLFLRTSESERWRALRTTLD